MKTSNRKNRAEESGRASEYQSNYINKQRALLHNFIQKIRQQGSMTQFIKKSLSVISCNLSQITFFKLEKFQAHFSFRNIMTVAEDAT